MSVFQTGLYYREFYWLCMRNCMRNNSIQIENIQLAHLGLKMLFRYKMLFCIYLSYLSYIYLSYFELFKQRAVIASFTSLDLSIYLLFNQKDKGTFNSLQEKKVQHTIKFLSFREHPRVYLSCAAPTFMLFHYSLLLKFVNNCEISYQDNEFTLSQLKLSLHFKIQCF